MSRSITGNGIQLCPYRYWHFCTLVQYQYGHNSLPALACYYARTGIGIVAHWFSTSMGIVHYQYWHSIVPVPALAFLHFGSLPVWSQYITSTGICSLCPYWYWHFCTLVQYQYWHIPLPELAFKNDAHTGIDIVARWFSSGMGTVCTGTGI